jgi:cyclopropane-fatty-acyl-phospholipid synthase
MLALTCERAGIAAGQSVLDLGSGWGALAMWIAERHPDTRVTALTDVPGHADFIRAQARERGLRPPDVICADARTYEPATPFDRIVAVETLEALPDWPALLARLRRGLAPGGALFVHALACRDYAYDESSGPDEAWLARHVFTGGLMPGDDLLAACAAGFVEEARWIVPGDDVARTARAWLARLDAAAPRLRAELARAGTPGAARALRRWRVLLLACDALFAHDQGRAWHVVHALLRPAR